MITIFTSTRSWGGYGRVRVGRRMGEEERVRNIENEEARIMRKSEGVGEREGGGWKNC